MCGTQARTHGGNVARGFGFPPSCAAVALQSAPESQRFQAVAQRSTSGGGNGARARRAEMRSVVMRRAVVWA
jgi:hypothetical protein